MEEKIEGLCQFRFQYAVVIYVELLERWEDLNGELLDRSRAVGDLLRASSAVQDVPGSDWPPADIVPGSLCAELT